MNTNQKIIGYTFAMVCIISALYLITTAVFVLNNQEYLNEVAEEQGFNTNQAYISVITSFAILIMPLIFLAVVIIIIIRYLDKNNKVNQIKKTNNNHLFGNVLPYNYYALFGSEEDQKEGESNKNNLLKSIILYLKNPVYKLKPKKTSFNSKFWDVLRITSLTIFISFLLGLILTFALNAVGYNMDQHALSDPEWQFPIVIILYGILIGPIQEELTCRMGLKYSPFRLSFSLAFFTILIFPMIISYLDFSISSEIYILIIISSFSLIGVVLGLYLKYRANQKPIINFYKSNFRFIFYLSAVVFAALHFSNYSNFGQIWFLAPLLVSSQFVGGVTLAYVRMKYGLSWSIFQHMATNAIFFSPTILSGIVKINDANNTLGSESILLALFTIIGLIIVFVVLFSSMHPICEYLYLKHSKNLDI